MNHSEQTYSSREPLYPNYLPNNTPIRQKKKKKETNYIKQNCIYLLSPEKIQIFVSQEIMIYKSSKKNKLGQWRKRLPSDCYFILNVPIIFSEYYIYSGGSNGWRSTQVIWVFPFEITKKKNERESILAVDHVIVQYFSYLQ